MSFYFVSFHSIRTLASCLKRDRPLPHNRSTFLGGWNAQPNAPEFGAISPCEMNEFSDECEAWEAENGPYEKAEYMVKSNSRTKGR